MYSDSDLDAAVSAGAISADAVANLRAFFDQQRRTPAADEEQFRLLTGFNDVFVSIAIILLLVALGTLGSTIARGAAGAAIAALSWPLAEYFTRKRRMALPSIILLLSFVGGVFACGAEFAAKPADNTMLIAGCAAMSACAAYLHWRRFMVPITVATGVGAAIVTLLALLLGQVSALRDHWEPIVLVCGLLVFAIAMRWDMSDPERRTRRSDVAFWLHLAAAPLIVHPIFSILDLAPPTAFVYPAKIPTIIDLAGQEVGAVATYLILAMLALAVDRRALLVSALVYVLYTTREFVWALGSIDTAFALTALVIGSALLLLSALWHRVRGWVIGVLPQSLAVRLPAL